MLWFRHDGAACSALWQWMNATSVEVNWTSRDNTYQYTQLSYKLGEEFGRILPGFLQRWLGWSVQDFSCTVNVEKVFFLSSSLFLSQLSFHHLLEAAVPRNK
jgi:hypothetical protein